jgi:hypothetical protein
MATILQIAANQANAQKSTGPKTPEGKAASSRNRLSHGFASSATIMPGENPEEFKALIDDLSAQYQPANTTEQILIEKMAQNQWLSLRAFRLQGLAFLHQSLNQENFGIPKDLGLLIRYQTSADRAFHRAHNELVKAQKERKKSEIGFESKSSGKSANSASSERATDPKNIHITAVTPEFAPKVAKTAV